jgi:hypothetical protein
METINNITAAASKAIWGDAETNKEPISGATGDVAKGQPYDAGNLGLADQERVEDKLESNNNYEPTADSSYTTSATKPASSSLADAKPRAVDMDHSTTAVAPLPSTTSTSTSTTTGAAAGTGTAANVAHAAKHAPEDTSAQQNTLRAPEDNDKDKDKDEAEPKIDVSKPGPRPVHVVAKENGGDAGRSHEADSKTSSASALDSASDKAAKDKDAASESESKGSGEMYVKTSGVAADGGDFDATKPGAGREADRIMEEKGIHHDDPKSASKKDSSPTSGPAADSGSPKAGHGHHKDKPSLGERIKAKLHKH